MIKSFVIISSLYLSACTSRVPIPAPEVRALKAAHLAKTAGFKAHTIHTASFTLKAYGSSGASTGKILTIYFEGDGVAWFAEDTPSNNPTPMIPTGLKMAIHDHNNRPIAYLARPCQYVFNQEWLGCRGAYWTHLRFSPEVINSTNQAVDYLKKYYQAQQIILIGYSGGGTIAALVAAKRTDVIQLITVAAILDINQWVRQKSLTPLYGSLNPADSWKKLATIAQTHWIGGKDTVVPKEVAFAFASHFPTDQKPNMIIISNFDHVCCWATDWNLKYR